MARRTLSPPVPGASLAPGGPGVARALLSLKADLKRLLDSDRPDEIPVCPDVDAAKVDDGFRGTLGNAGVDLSAYEDGAFETSAVRSCEYSLAPRDGRSST